MRNHLHGKSILATNPKISFRALERAALHIHTHPLLPPGLKVSVNDFTILSK